MRADIAIEQRDVALAEHLLASVLAQDAALAIEVVPRLMRLARAAGADGDAVVARLVAARPDAGNEIAIASIMADALDFAPLERARSRIAWRRTRRIAGLVRAIGRDPATLDARAVREIAIVLRRLAATTPRYRCANLRFLEHRSLLAVPRLQELGQPASAAAIRSRRPACERGQPAAPESPEMRVIDARRAQRRGS